MTAAVAEVVTSATETAVAMMIRRSMGRDSWVEGMRGRYEAPRKLRPIGR
jgi:hypothetical protein